ncbi:TetR/AcrR family transcriptional regulator [Brachybacterium sacelli]|uniref:AcrR family transcriptional regulator n=1 Tax=Brachybacterium sacelli TaxID=173364 RepID=A0ABS4X056_9MICO|nr:TetR/AcrR family transcriptional regulator [Brachybacterium sacelli]MBP2381840.1 AcrR family transcriptional regulator [Brachybacterium sacelli]
MSPVARRRLPPAERRGLILEAALETVAAKGFAAASLEAIAVQAGVSKALVSHYAAGRDELMASTARAALARLREEVARQVDLEAPVPDLLRSAVRAAARLARSHERELAALEQIVSALRDEHGRPVLGIEDFEETFVGQERLLRRGQQEGSIAREADVRALALTYQGAVEMMMSQVRARPGIDAEETADAIVDVLLTGMMPRP